jgi:hypothetical protein
MGSQTGSYPLPSTTSLLTPSCQQNPTVPPLHLVDTGRPSFPVGHLSSSSPEERRSAGEKWWLVCRGVGVVSVDVVRRWGSRALLLGHGAGVMGVGGRQWSYFAYYDCSSLDRASRTTRHFYRRRSYEQHPKDRCHVAIFEHTHSHTYALIINCVNACLHIGTSNISYGGWYPFDNDGTFRVQVAKELEFRNGDLQQGFDCILEHQNIKGVWEEGGCVSISCIVTVLEDEFIEVPPSSTYKSICATIAAQAPMDVVFDICGRVNRVRCANAVAVSCVMEACLCGAEWSQSLIVFQLKILTLMASRFWSYMLAKDHSRRRLICGTPLSMFGLCSSHLVHVLSRTIEAALCFMTCAQIVRTFLQWTTKANCTQL